MRNDIIKKLKNKGIRLRSVRHRQAVVELENGGRYALRLSREIITRRKYKTIKTGKMHTYTYGYYVLNMTSLPEDVDGVLVIFIGKNERIEKVATVSKYLTEIRRTMMSRDSLDGYAESVLFDIDDD